MKYTKANFAKPLLKKLEEEPFDIVKISRWCHRLYSDNLRDLDDDLYNLLFELSTMDDDPQFEYNKEELIQLAENILKEQKNQFEILIASLPTRENCVCEIYYENEQWAEISKEGSEVMIQFYPNSSQSYWEFPLNQALEILENAKKYF